MAAEVPPMGRLRLARLSDIDRIGLIAAASFYHSTFFPYSRPLYQCFPRDTIAKYRAEYRAGILDPNEVVLVAVDEFNTAEVDFVYDALKSAYPRDEGNKQDSGGTVVGVISLSLRNDSKRHGQFNPEGSLTRHIQNSDLIRVVWPFADIVRSEGRRAGRRP